MAAVLSLAALTACGQTSTPERDAAPTNPPDTPSSSQSPTSEQAAAREQVRRAYLGMWHDYVAAGHQTNPNVETLTQHAAGDAFSQLAGALRENEKEGAVTRGKPTFDPKVTSLKPAKHPKRAKVRDCADGSHWLRYDAKTGKAIKDEPSGTHRIHAVVSKVPNGPWKVTRLDIGEVGSC